jgi:hypothetical protein
LQKTTALSLPFFEDFTHAILYNYPDSNLWEDRYIYVNNTMGVNPVSRGVATFDALNERGLPYNDSNANGAVIADSLTCKPIDLSGYKPADSLYLSFYYQPQGNGFNPEIGDSLMLFLRRNTNTSAWVKVWSVPGNTLQPFKQVMIPIVAEDYFYDAFQFRFVNRATMRDNDDHWHLDYIRLNSGRSIGDTIINDVAFSKEPSHILNDFTNMPYHQFLADPGRELAGQHTATVNNHTPNAQTITYNYIATEQVTGNFLASGNASSMSVGPYTYQDFGYPVYNANIPGTGGYQRAVFENKYYINPVAGDNNRQNDTIVRNQTFENYLAYDDGTAEISYYIDQSPTLPGKIAVEFHLNQPDTIKGLAIYFGRQLPLYKPFSIAVYRRLGVNGGPGDDLVYQEDDLIPGYLRNDNFYVYKFKTPVVLSAGTFYIGTIQPALSNSDSLYIGFDVNRVGANHLYYNIYGAWRPSGFSGALMIRPIIGPIIASGVPHTRREGSPWYISPNPTHSHAIITYSLEGSADYLVYNMEGRIVRRGIVSSGDRIDISALQPGIYFIKLIKEGISDMPVQIIKD